MRVTGTDNMYGQNTMNVLPFGIVLIGFAPNVLCMHLVPYWHLTILEERTNAILNESCFAPVLGWG
jgi:hypothetical protein